MVEERRVSYRPWKVSKYRLLAYPLKSYVWEGMTHSN